MLFSLVISVGCFIHAQAYIYIYIYIYAKVGPGKRRPYIYIYIYIHRYSLPPPNSSPANCPFAEAGLA